jgi:RNA polymerase sigma factor (sigma-70 family)
MHRLGALHSSDAGSDPAGNQRFEPHEPTLGELLRRAVERDRTAWDVLVRRFGWLVLRTGRRIGLNQADAADAAQLTWLRLVEHAHQIREPERLPAWLTATARREGLRLAIDAKRCVLLPDPTTENGVDSRGAVVDVYAVDGDYGPEVEAALARLPARYEQLLRLLMSDDCPSYTEIAARTHLPIGSIGPMRMRALQMLRNTPEFTDAAIPGRASAESSVPRPRRAA